MNATPCNNRQSALVLGNDARVSLAVIRSLGRRGVEVHTGWCEDRGPANASRYVRKCHTIPPYNTADNAWKRVLRDLLREHRFDLVVPCNDPAVIPLQLHRQEFEQLANLYLLDDSVFQIVFDKLRTTMLAKRLGVPVPGTVAGETLEEIYCGCERFRFPAFVKPRRSVTRDDLMNKQVVRRVDSIEQLARHLETIPCVSGILVQELFHGCGVGVEVLAAGGEIFAELQHRRLHESLAGGSSYRETVPPNKELSDATRTLVKALNYSGVGMFEYRVDEHSSQWVLLEINGRFWGSLPLALAAGMDFPYYLYQLLVQQKKAAHREYQCGLRARNLVEDLRWMRRHLSKGIGCVPELCGDLLRLATGRDCLDQWAWDDWRPQLRELAQFGQHAGKKLLGRLLAGSEWSKNSAACQPVGNNEFGSGNVPIFRPG